MLDLDIATIVFQVVNFLLLTAIVYRFLLRPVMRRVKERTAEKERLMQEIKLERERTAEAHAEVEQRLARAEEEAQEIISSAHERIEAAQKALVEEAYHEAERIRAEAHQEGLRVRQQALAESYEDILDTVVELSTTVLQRAAPAELHDLLVKRLTDSVWELGRHDITRVEDFRRSLGERTPTASIAVARPLTNEQQAALSRTLNALADRQVTLEVKVDPDLVAGMRVRVADMVMDSSVARDLADVRSGVAKTLKERLPGG